MCLEMYRLNKETGDLGEMLATKYLLQSNYRILYRNFRNRFGEIDIICKYNDMIIFVEVKSRYNNSYGTPSESVTYLKQQQIIKTSRSYIYKYNAHNFNFRYDVIELYLDHKTNKYRLNHIKDAFRGN